MSLVAEFMAPKPKASSRAITELLDQFFFRGQQATIPMPFRQFVALSLVLSLGCAPSTPTAAVPAGKSAGRYTVITTTAMVTDIVQHVAGDHADVRGLMGTGVDPHLFRPSTSDHAKLLAADVIFYSGLMLEGGVDQVLKSARAGNLHLPSPMTSTRHMFADQSSSRGTPIRTFGTMCPLGFSAWRASRDDSPNSIHLTPRSIAQTLRSTAQNLPNSTRMRNG